MGKAVAKCPPYRLIASVADGDEKAIEKCFNSMTLTFQSVVFVLCMMNTEIFILLLIWN